MKMLKCALIAAGLFASTTGQAAIVENEANVSASSESTCYLVAIIITAEDTFGVYECYDNGDGTA